MSPRGPTAFKVDPFLGTQNTEELSAFGEANGDPGGSWQATVRNN